MKEDLKKTLKCCCTRLTVSSGKKYLPGKRCQRSGHVARCEKEKLRQTSCKPDVTLLKNGRSYTLSPRTERLAAKELQSFCSTESSVGLPVFNEYERNYSLCKSKTCRFHCFCFSAEKENTKNVCHSNFPIKHLT